MKPYKPKGNWQDPKRPNRKQPSGFWRKKFKCKRLKGDHNFELVKPSENWHFKEEYPELTVEEYYEKKDREDDECRDNPLRWCRFGKYRHYKCVACGKHEMKRL